MGERFDPQEVKSRLSFLDIMLNEAIPTKRAGGLHIAPCPFHTEKSGSFTIYSYDNKSEDHAHCFGCGWNGDIIKFWRERRGVGFIDAIASLASLASVSPTVWEGKRKQAAAAALTGTTRMTRGLKEKPALPRMSFLKKEEIAMLAQLRGLAVAGIEAAMQDRRVGVCLWPQYLDRNNAWTIVKDAAPCWVVTDNERRVAQFRRLDGAEFEVKDREPIKAWTKGSPTWPLGAGEMGDRGGVLLVEGGADMLAAYHFLERFGRLRHVAVCAMLGGSCAIADEALPFFARKRVRIIMDEDEGKPVPNHPEKPLIFPGREAAARWQAGLIEAGAAVEVFSLAGLLRKDGKKVKDLNDLALVDEAAWLDPELRAAFFDFDF